MFLSKEEVERILVRKELQPHYEDPIVQEAFADQTILVVGSAGSVGHAVCDAIVSKLPYKQLILFDQGESPLVLQYRLLSEKKQKSHQLDYFLGDLTHEEDLVEVFEKFLPGIVINAAAIKHVAIAERQIHKSWRVNVKGVELFWHICKKYGAQQFIHISTDKAVYPTTRMGITKRLAELFLLKKMSQINDPVLKVLRFGNVLGSRGSILPLAEQQQAHGLPLEISDWSCLRYYISSREASWFVLASIAYTNHSILAIGNVGEPVKLRHLLDNYVNLRGIHSDLLITKTIGLQYQEKLEELLLYDFESKKEEVAVGLFTIDFPEPKENDENLLLSELGLVGSNKNSPNSDFHKKNRTPFN